MTDLTDTQKINNLWKTSKGVVDINKPENYVSSTEKGAIKNVLNESIFSEDVPDKIPGNIINLNTLGGPNVNITEYSVAALDLSFNALGLEPGEVPPSTPSNERSSAIGGGFEGLKLTSVGLPHLVYYHRIPLVEVNSANTTPNNKCKTSWYLPDPSNNNMSAIRNTINFKKGNLAQGHYNQKFFIYDVVPGPSGPNYAYQSAPQQLDDPYYFVFDNESGYVLIYGETDGSPIWYLDVALNRQLCVSFIRYEGGLGASGGGATVDVGNVNLMQTLELQGATPKYHIPYAGSTFFIGPLGNFYMPIANYIIASVDNTDSCAMGYFTLKIKGAGYDTTCQFMATILENKQPIIKVLSSSISDPLSGFGKLIMYDNRSVNGKWYICLGLDQTLRVGLTPIQPYYRAAVSTPTPPIWWNGASAPLVDVVRITLVNNNANQNDNTLIPLAIGNWELSSPTTFFDPTLAPIHSGSGIWLTGVASGGLSTGNPDPFSTFIDRYKLGCNLLMGGATPDMNLASDTAVNVFHNDIIMKDDTKIKILDLSSNPANTSLSGFWDYVSGGHNNLDLGKFTIEAEEIYLKSDKITDINSTVSINGSINFVEEGWIINENYGVFQEKYYTNSDFTSDNFSPGSSGEWVTIARTTLSRLAKTRTASALFEIIDKSNTIDNGAVNGTIDLSGNFDPASFDEYILASVSWHYDVNDLRGLVTSTFDTISGTIAPADVTVNIINCRCGNNTPDPNYVGGSSAAPRGYIGKLRVQTGLYEVPSASGDHVAVAHLQLFRYANGVQAPNGTNVGQTDLKVRMIGNNMDRADNSITSWEFSSVPHTITIVHPDDTTTHNMEYNLLDTGSVISTTSSTKLFIENDNTYSKKIVIGNRNNESTHCISLLGGNTKTGNRAVLNLNGGQGDNVITGDVYFQSPGGTQGLGESFSNSLYTKNFYNNELENVALCRLSSFDLSGNLTGGLQANEDDWVTIAAVSQRDSVSRRADALFELTERTSGIQHTVTFRAGLCFSFNTSDSTLRHENNYIEVLNNRTYQGTVTFKKLRIMFNGNNTSSGSGSSSTTSSSRGTTYGGGVLQVQIDTTGSRHRGKCYLKIYQNTRQDGWISNDDVFAKYGKLANVPVWDTVYNNSSDNYSENKFVDLTKNTQISTHNKSWKLYNRSGYPEDNINTPSVWPGTSSTTGYPLNIKINDWLDMGGSTIVNMWDSPESWVDGASTIRRNGINLDDISEHRGKSAVNLRTLNLYYQKYRSCVVPYVGTENQINTYVNELNMEKRFRTSEGVVTHLIEPSSANARSTSVPEIQGLLYYNKFLARHAIISNGIMNLKWGTSMFQSWNTQSRTISTSYTPNGQATGHGNIEFKNGVPTSVDNQRINKNDYVGNSIILNDGTFGWVQSSPIYTSISTATVAEAATLELFCSQPSSTSNEIPSNSYLRFRSHKSTLGIPSVRGTMSWYNDSIFYPDSNGFVNNKRNAYNTPYNIWHHMPQKNMSGYILGATFRGTVEVRAAWSQWEVINDDVKIKFVLTGTKYQENSSASNQGPDIHELTDLITFTAAGSSQGPDGEYGPNQYNNNEYKKFYPNNGNGELSNAIFIGKDGSYTFPEPQFNVEESGHPGQGTVDQRFDALGIRVVIEIPGRKNINSTAIQSEFRLYFSRENDLVYHFLPIAQGTPVQTSTQNLTSDGTGYSP